MSLNRESESRAETLGNIGAYLEEARHYMNESRIPREYSRYTSGRFGCYRNLEFDGSGNPLPNAAEALISEEVRNPRISRQILT